MILGDLSGNLALVTGFREGIGEATCRALRAQGCRVVGLDRLSAGVEEEDLLELRCDLSRPAEIDLAFQTIGQKTAHIDYLVNVAGIDPTFSLQEGDEYCWDQVLNVNLRAYYLLIRQAVPLLRSGKGKSIVNVSSINYRLGIPGRSIYSASKAGILGLTTGLARELGKEGIRINSVSPGWVFTRRQVEEFFHEPAERKRNLQLLGDRQALARRISPEDIANHILFYLSEASAASTGHNCVVDGGWLLE